MNERVDAILEAARLLTSEERREAARRLMSADEPALAAVDEAWISEAEARYQSYKRGEVEALDADEMLAELRTWSDKRKTRKRSLR